MIMMTMTIYKFKGPFQRNCKESKSVQNILIIFLCTRHLRLNLVLSFSLYCLWIVLSWCVNKSVISFKWKYLQRTTMLLLVIFNKVIYDVLASCSEHLGHLQLGVNLVRIYTLCYFISQNKHLSSTSLSLSPLLSVSFFKTTK